jgi:transcriptional regulator with XRE-family HTH domain
MFFSDLSDLLLQALRARLRNGEMTERGLAKRVGVSQPHIHNVLKGVRTLSPELCDQILKLLRMSVLDLIEAAALRQYLEQREECEGSTLAFLPLLEGTVGPGQPWPCQTERFARLRLPHALTAQLAHPVVVRAAADARMRPAVTEGDLLLLDQSLKARLDPQPDHLYLLKLGRCGLVRRLRVRDSSLFVVTEDALDRPNAWERVDLTGCNLQHVVRARALPLPPEQQWI